jgi:hypothetical protein
MLLVIPAEVVEEKPPARPQEPLRQDDSEPVGAPVLGAIHEDEVVFGLDRTSRIKTLLNFSLQKPSVSGKPLIKSNPAAKPGLFQHLPGRRVKPLPPGRIDARQVTGAVGLKRCCHEHGRPAPTGTQLQQVPRPVVSYVLVEHTALASRYMRDRYPLNDPRGLIEVHRSTLVSGPEPYRPESIR